MNKMVFFHPWHKYLILKEGVENLFLTLYIWACYRLLKLQGFHFLEKIFEWIFCYQLVHEPFTTFSSFIWRTQEIRKFLKLPLFNLCVWNWGIVNFMDLKLNFLKLNFDMEDWNVFVIFLNILSKNGKKI